ncbi:hypothetical protein M8C21_005107, partial [Ambrosia artemisiifolia]
MPKVANVTNNSSIFDHHLQSFKFRRRQEHKQSRSLIISMTRNELDESHSQSGINFNEESNTWKEMSLRLELL